MKKFPSIIHCTFEADNDGSEYLIANMDGVASMEAGDRCAIYKLVEEGTVRGPKSFVSKKRKP